MPGQENETNSGKRKVQDRLSTDSSFEKAQPNPKKTGATNGTRNKTGVTIPQKDNSVNKAEKNEKSDKGQQKITQLYPTSDNVSILKQLTSLTSTILDMNNKMSKMVTIEHFEEKFKELVTRQDLDRATGEVKAEMSTRFDEKLDRLEGRLFDLEVKNDHLEDENKRLNEKLNESDYQLQEVNRDIQYALQKKQRPRTIH